MRAQGAIVNVLRCPSARSTAGVHFGKSPSGRISVRTMLAEQPTAEQLALIVEKANAKVEEGASLFTVTMPREQAESTFGGLMYDSFRVPPSVTDLHMIYVPEWTLNVVAAPCLNTAAGIGTISVNKVCCHRFFSGREASASCMTHRGFMCVCVRVPPRRSGRRRTANGSCTSS